MDVDRIGSSVEIAELERWRNRLHEAIDQGFVMDVRRLTLIFPCNFL